MTIEKFVRKCDEAWEEGDIHPVLGLYNCKEVLFYDKQGASLNVDKDTGERTSIPNFIERFYGQDGRVCSDTYEYPYIGDNFIIDSWVMYDRDAESLSKENILLHGTDFMHIEDNRIVNSVVHHTDPDDSILDKIRNSKFCLDSTLKKANNVKYVTSKIPDEELNKCQMGLTYLMEEERYYLDSEASLDRVAERLKVSRSCVSQTLSLKLNKRFENMINDYRIKEVIAIMSTLDSLTASSIIDIAMDVGYNSTSCFYRAFKSFTGTSPSRYYEAVLKR